MNYQRLKSFVIDTQRSLDHWKMFSGDLEPKRGMLSWRWNDTKILGNNGGNPWRVGVRACMSAFCTVANVDASGC
jgi:hypothetical protein